VIYFCALSLTTLLRRVEQGVHAGLPALRSGRPSVAWRAIPLLALGGYVLYANVQTYFWRQANDMFSWRAFSTAESIAGRRMAELGPGYGFYLSPLFGEHPSIRFLSPETHDHRLLTLPDALPIRRPDDRPVALFIHPDDGAVVDLAQRLYPAAGFETVYDPAGRTPVLYVVTLTRSDIAHPQGLELRAWQGQAWRGQEWEGPPQAIARVDAVDGSWPDLSSGSLLSALSEGGAVTAQWSGVLYASQYGLYRFVLRAPAGATLDLDGQMVVMAGVGGQGTASLALAQGNHRLRIRAQSGPDQVSLLWQPTGGRVEIVPQWALYAPPVTAHGLRGSFYDNLTWEGTPTLVRVDPVLDTYFHLTPLSRPYSAEWVGTIQVPVSGTYQLSLRAVDWAQLSLDGEVVVETGTPGEDTLATVALSQGLYDLRLRFQDRTERSRLHLLWRPPGQDSLTAIPSRVLRPAPAEPASPDLEDRTVGL
jgi:hypothetical protein